MDASNLRTLDPQDWNSFRELAHRMVDETLEHLQGLGEAPSWRSMPKTVRRALSEESLPYSGIGEAAVFEEYLDKVRPYPNGSLSPRHFGWVHGNGFPLAAMADMLASALNPHLAGYDQAPALVEQKVVDWCRQIMGFPDGASGLLLSGGSMANFTGLVVARDALAGYDIRTEGAARAASMRVYGSTETHSWLRKAVDVLGLGTQAYQPISVNERYEIRLDVLKNQIRKDRDAGLRPAVVVGTAGTVNTGATDDLHGLADLCAKEGLWLHIDGAFGALATLSPAHRPLVAGLERADSIGFDLHKWMYLPFEIACLLIRDGEQHRAAFSQRAAYLANLDRGVAAGGFPFADLGLELTRGFKALKAWMSLKAYGLNLFGELIERNIEQAAYLKDLVQAHDELQLAAPVPLNIVCFRYVVPGFEGRQLDELNREILLQLQEQGIATPSSTVLEGRFAIRVCIVNHRTQLSDLDLLIDESLRIGRSLCP